MKVLMKNLALFVLLVSVTSTSALAVRRIVIIEDRVPNGAQVFNFTGSGNGISGNQPISFPLDDNTATALSNTRTFTLQNQAGQRIITQNAVADYTLAITCTSSNGAVATVSVPNRRVSITFNGNQNGLATCTFRNTYVDPCPANTACASDGNPCTLDVCDNHICTHPAGNAGTVCKSSAGICDVQEVCNGINPACPADAFVSNGTVCRPSVSTCDATESCTGASASCPPGDGALQCGIEKFVVAAKQSWTAPNGDVIPMWGYVEVANLADLNAYDCGTTTAWKPPEMNITSSNDPVVVYVKNCLDEPTSLAIPGLTPINQTPVFNGSRVVSFAQRTNAGDIGLYRYRASPGTYLFQSGDSVAKQVPMGLYATLIVKPITGEVYPGVNADAERVLLFSEIDPAHHNTGVDAARFVHPLDYRPKYFLINGKAHESTNINNLAAVLVGQKVVLRLLNAGITSHTATLGNGLYLKEIAEDGHPVTYPQLKYGVHLVPGKTHDALMTAPASPTRIPVFDRNGGLSNNGVLNGGMLIYLPVQ